MKSPSGNSTTCNFGRFSTRYGPLVRAACLRQSRHQTVPGCRACRREPKYLIAQLEFDHALLAVHDDGRQANPPQLAASRVD